MEANNFREENYLKLVIRETNILRKLSSDLKGHPNLVKLIDIISPKDLVTSKEQYLLLVMEYMPSDLHEMMNKSKKQKYGEKEVAKIAYQIISALCYMHSAGLMHRDLKPSNILVDDEFNIKICDFGLARSVLNENDLQKKSTKMRRKLSDKCQTRWYRAPEVILLEKIYNEKIDLWSLGCILSELIYCSKEYSKFNQKLHERILFKGDSCYPMSPIDQKSREDDDTACVSEHDQLKLILGVIGDQDSNNLSFISD